MDFLKSAGLDGPLVVKVVVGLAVLVAILVAFQWLLNNPLVLIGAVAVIGGGIFAFVRYRKHRNKV